MKGTGVNEHWNLVDEFSGYLLKSQTTNLTGTVTTVSKLVDNLPDTSNLNFMEIR